MLKVELHEAKPLRWWYEQSLYQRIDMSPDYQRKADIWSKWKRAHLIDSVLNDFDIPKFYVANFFLGAGGLDNPEQKGYAIIDGKQRFGAIFSFFADELALNPTFVLNDNPSLSLGKLTYSELRSRFPSIARKMDSFVPTVMNVRADDDAQIEQLFVRLNMGEATTGAERRNAAGGPVPIIVRELAQHAFFTRNVRFATSRMQEHNLIAKLVLFEFKQGFDDTKSKNLDDFAKGAKEWIAAAPEDVQSSMGIYAQIRDRISEVLEVLSTEFEEKDKVLTRAGEIPIYYWIAREHPDWVNELRDFIVEFSDAVIDNLRLTRDGKSRGDPELSAYYTMMRTSNDQQSLRGRYKIFERRFESFRKPLGRRKV